MARVIEPRKEGPLRRRHETAERIDGRIAEAAKDLERAASRLRRRHITVTTHVVTGANVAEQLIGLARALGCDAIVVGSQSLHERTRLPLGKVADKVLRGATQPVLLVPVARRRARQAGGDAARPRNRREGVGKRQPA